jgi:hypothetical protein
VAYFSLPVPVHQWHEALYKSHAQRAVVGAGGVEPPSSSVSDPTRVSPLEFETV